MLTIIIKRFKHNHFDFIFYLKMLISVLETYLREEEIGDISIDNLLQYSFHNELYTFIKNSNKSTSIHIFETKALLKNAELNYFWVNYNKILSYCIFSDCVLFFVCLYFI